MDEPPAENLPAEIEPPAPEIEPSAPEIEPSSGGEEIVFAEVRPLPARPVVRPAVQAAAVAATGFVAGAATFALIRRGAQRRPAARAGRPVRPRSTPGDLPIVSSRRYLVDVHVLGRE